MTEGRRYIKSRVFDGPAYPKLTEDDPDTARLAEIEGRTRRTVGFIIREVAGHENLADDPCRYALEIGWALGGGSRRSALHSLSEADIRALHHLTGAMLRGDLLPVSIPPPVNGK